MKKSHFFIIIVALSLFNIYSCYKQVILKKQYLDNNKISEEIISRNTFFIKNLKKLIFNNYNTKKINSADTHIKEIFDKDKIVLYITEGNCSSCIHQALNYMELLSQSIGKNRLILMGNFISRKSFEDFVNSIPNYFGNSVYCNDAGFSDDINKHPTIFIVKNDLSIQALFIPDFYPNLTEEYYTKILPSYYRNME